MLLAAIGSFGLNFAAVGQSLIDPTYDPNVGISSEGAAQTYVFTMAIQPGKKMLVGGHFSTLGKGNKAFYHGSLARLTDNGLAEDGRYFTAYPGDPDPTTLPSDRTSDPFIDTLCVTANHDTFVSGNFNVIGGESHKWFGFIDNRIGAGVFYNAAPVIRWPGHGVSTTGHLLPTGEPIVFGAFLTADGSTLRSFAKQTGSFGELKADPIFDADFRGTEADEVPFIYVVQHLPDGKLLVAGDFTSVDGVARTSMVRLNADFTLDGSFTYGGLSSFPTAIVAQPDGHILVAGASVERLTPNGAHDPTFARVSADGYISSMVLRADGKVVIGGFFKKLNLNVTRSGVAMLSSTGVIDPAFDPNVEASSILGTSVQYPIVHSLAIQEDGKVAIGGSFSKVSGVTRKGLARMTADVPALDDLVVAADHSNIVWTRGGSAPEIVDVLFEKSTNGGKTFTALPAPTYTGTGWALTGLSASTLPFSTSLYVRATASTNSGYGANSYGLIEKKYGPKATFIDQPDALNIAQGAAATFTADCRSTLPFTSFHWKRNGVTLVDGPNITGSTTLTLNIAAALLADGGSYTLTATTAAGSVTSAGALLKVIVPPTIVTPPVNLVVGLGKTTTFKVVASGTSPTYLWTGPFPVNATGKTGPTLSFGNSQFAHEGNYSVTMMNLAGTVTTTDVTLNVVGPPTVAAPPALIAGVGDSPVLTAAVVSEVPPSVHQWLKVATAVPGGTSPALTLNNVQLKEAGAYALRVTNPASTVTGAKGELAVVDDLNLRTQVQKETGTAVFTAQAAGNSLTYVWNYAGNPITIDNVKYFKSKTGNVLTVKNLLLTDAGDYTCTVTAPGGTLTTAAEHLYVTNGVPVLLPLTFTENGMVGAPLSKQVDDNGVVTTKPAKFTMKISPALKGLTISPTGLITGTPQSAGTFTITVGSSNAQGPSNEVTATLVVEPVPSTAVGKFVALVGRQAALNGDLGGRLDLAVLPSGAYSGSLTLGANAAYRFSGGRLGTTAAGDLMPATINNPTNTIVISRGKVLTPVTLNFDLNLADNTLSGTVVDGAITATLNGWRQTWNAKANPATADYLGRFNFAYTAPADGVGLQTWPHGFGYGSMTVPTSGDVKAAGVLADKTAFTTAAFLGPQGQFLVFAPLYKGKGSFLASHKISAAGGPVVDYALPAATSWLRKDQAPTVSYSYPSGFGPITLAVNGMRYDTTTVGNNVIGSDTATEDTALAFVDGGLGAASINPNVNLTLSSANKATFGAANPGKVTLSVDNKLGTFKGTFTLADDIDPGPALVSVPRKAVPFSGVIIRNPAGKGSGFGFFALSSLPVLPVKTTAKTPIYSGSVELKDLTP